METKPLDRLEITDVILITVTLTLLCVAVGLWYTGFLTGVPSIFDLDVHAMIYDHIPDFIKKPARFLRYTLARFFQFLLQILGANDTHIVTVVSTSPVFAHVQELTDLKASRQTQRRHCHFDKRQGCTTQGQCRAPD